MTVHMLYNEGTPEKARLDDLATQLEPLDVTVDMVDADSRGGIGMAESYDVVARPAVILVREDGTPIQIWAGPDDLPTAGDISYLFHQ